MIDELMIRALHVEALRHSDLHAEREPHVLFQASTIGALLQGAYDGDVSFAELAAHGDLGLGTTNGLDGEMIALDGCFYRARLGGRVEPIASSEQTPFAVVVWFSPSYEFSLEAGLEHAELLASIEAHLPPGVVACAVRIDGEFQSVRARSVPKQSPPYRPLGEVVADQDVFEFNDVRGSLVGFRFPEYSQGIEVGGWHFHFIDDARKRGGHVLEVRPRRVRVALDPSADLHVELPPGVELSAPDLSTATHEALARIEG